LTGVPQPPLVETILDDDLCQITTSMEVRNAQIRNSLPLPNHVPGSSVWFLICYCGLEWRLGDWRKHGGDGDRDDELEKRWDTKKAPDMVNDLAYYLPPVLLPKMAW